MPSLPPDFETALTLLARASTRYHEATDFRVVIVGGAAVSFYTQGQVLSGDFDMVADIGFEDFLLSEGFLQEEGSGRLLGGYYHPAVPRLGFELVSGALFDGRSDDNKILAVKITEDTEVLFPPVEDMIADRLGQYASSNNKQVEMLSQAEILLSLALEYDRDYLVRRIKEEGGDPAVIGLA